MFYTPNRKCKRNGTYMFESSKPMKENLSPDETMLFRMLERSLKDISLGCRRTLDKEEIRAKESAMTWIKSDEHYAINQYVKICEILDIDVDICRDHIKELVHFYNDNPNTWINPHPEG